MMQQYEQACDLPDDWNSLCGDHYAMRRDYLIELEQISPYPMRYYAFRTRAGRLDSIMLTYEHKAFNLFMFTPINLRFRCTMIYLPLSISRSGLICGNETRREVEKCLHNIPGYKVLLNVPPDFSLKGFYGDSTFPRIVLKLRWDSLADYLGDMRSPYRRRLQIALRKSAALHFAELASPSDFSRAHYALYEQVFAQSKTPIEKLSIDFFRASFSHVIVASNNGQPVGFVQYIENDKELVFAFVGLDYSYNQRFDIYHSLLLKLIEHGIQGGFSSVDLGQTAEDTKLKLGGQPEALLALVSHSNLVMRLGVKAIIGQLGYQFSHPRFRVFRETST